MLETLKTSNYPEVENEIEICKGMAYLKSKQIDKAIEAMKSFEKKDKKMMAKTFLIILIIFKSKNILIKKVHQIYLIFTFWKAIIKMPKNMQMWQLLMIVIMLRH